MGTSSAFIPPSYLLQYTDYIKSYYGLVSYLEYALLEERVLLFKLLQYRTFFRWSLALSETFLFLAFSISFTAACWKTSDSSTDNAYFQHFCPHAAPSLHCRPAPAQQLFHEPAWLLLICFPSLNLALMCIQLPSGQAAYNNDIWLLFFKVNINGEMNNNLKSFQKYEILFHEVLNFVSNMYSYINILHLQIICRAFATENALDVT